MREIEIQPRGGSYYIVVDGKEWSRHNSAEVAEKVRAELMRDEEKKRIKPVGFIGKDILAVEVKQNQMNDTQLLSRYYAQQERIEQLESWVIEAISKPCMTREMREQGLELVEELSSTIRATVERICPRRSQGLERSLEIER